VLFMQLNLDIFDLADVWRPPISYDVHPLRF